MNPIGVRHFKQLRAIIKSIRRGSSIVAACVAVKIDPSTLWEWRKRNNRLNELINNVIDSRIQMVEDALFKKAIEGDVGAQRLFLTNRAPERWKDKSILFNNTISASVGNRESARNLFKDIPTPVLKKVLEYIKKVENGEVERLLNIEKESKRSLVGPSTPQIEKSISTEHVV